MIVVRTEMTYKKSLQRTFGPLPILDLVKKGTWPEWPLNLGVVLPFLCNDGRKSEYCSSFHSGAASNYLNT